MVAGLVLIAGITFAIVWRHEHPGLAPAPTLSADAVSGGQVNLKWGSTSVTGNISYVIGRNGRQLVKLPSDTSTYRDLSVDPEQTYTYTLTVVDASGTLQTHRATARVNTPPAPPLSEAVLRGTWDVTGSYTSSTYPGISAGDTFSGTWTLASPCTTSDCEVDLSTDVLSLTLTRSGDQLTGSGTTTYDGGGCASSTETDAMVVNIVRAAFVKGIWTTTSIAGTVHRGADSFLCSPSDGDISFTGSPGS